jgi:hypothetical protein
MYRLILSYLERLIGHEYLRTIEKDGFLGAEQLLIKSAEAAGHSGDDHNHLNPFEVRLTKITEPKQRDEGYEGRSLGKP